MTCPCGVDHSWDPDCEGHPRNAAAIRTAILLGATFHVERTRYGEMHSVEGINHSSMHRTMPAWLFLATHGIGIDENGSPVVLGREKKDA